MLIALVSNSSKRVDAVLVLCSSKVRHNSLFEADIESSRKTDEDTAFAVPSLHDQNVYYLRLVDLSLRGPRLVRIRPRFAAYRRCFR
jgi:hypothetical protein